MQFVNYIMEHQIKLFKKAQLKIGMPLLLENV